MNTHPFPDTRWAAYLVVASAPVGLILILLSLGQSPEIKAFDISGIEKQILAFPNLLFKLALAALAFESLALIPLMLTTNRLLVTAHRFRWVRLGLTGFGILGALANALIHLLPLLSDVPLYTTLAMACTFWAWIGAWLVLTSVWHEIVISRQIHWLGASIGVVLILIPSLVTFDSLGGPTLNAIDLSMLIGLAIETIVVCITLPLWSILLTRALHSH